MIYFSKCMVLYTRTLDDRSKAGRSSSVGVESGLLHGFCNGYHDYFNEAVGPCTGVLVPL